MYRYFGAFIAGTEEIVAAILRQGLPGGSVRALSPGAVEFEAGQPYRRLSLPCFNNLFRVIWSAPAAPTKAGLEKFLRALPSARADWPAARPEEGKGRSFRLVVSCKNQLVGVSRPAKEAAEKKLAAETGLRLDRSLPDWEFWALVRDDGRAYLLRRLTRHRAYDKLLHPGELHPELAYMLCWLTDPRPTDRVADPFCGYGAIPAQRCARFPYASLYAGDLATGPLEAARQKLQKYKGVTVARQDALRLPETLGHGALDAIITDPPWGLYGDVGMELGEFYRLMLAAFAGALKPGGRAVVLTAAKRELAAALAGTPALSLSGRWDILVSGKKGAIFRLSKAGGAPPRP
ncbi:methyltransferase [Acutalibacter caecimuris]|uniref:methyltransferase n=1 Tax=Acutalibacter caecimuris TaxID=3093657 RepID=UPI002AC9D47B|nr:methyltransferase [Acutalibacter sp. M00118]